MDYGDFIVFVDESGDHSLTSIDPNFPVFCLAFCLFKKQQYVQVAVPLMQNFKFRWFGHDTVVMHEADIVKKRKQFAFLQYDDKRAQFMEELSVVMEAMPMRVFSTVIRKERLKSKYSSPDNPYKLSLLFCMERVFEYLDKEKCIDRTCHIVCESRSPREAGTGKEDASLELEFRRIVSGSHYLTKHQGMPCFEIVFASKLVNSTGLQIADLIARPIAKHCMMPDQNNRAFDAIRSKIAALKQFP